MLRQLRTLLLAGSLLVAGSVSYDLGTGYGAQAAESTDKLACGKACMKKKQYQQAQQDLQEYLKTQPNSCEGHLVLGQAYCAVHNYLKGKEQLRAAIRLGHGNANAQLANRELMKLPKQYLAVKSGPETRMLASMLGLTRVRGGITKPTVLNFYAKWCQPCKQLDPVLAKAKTQYGDQINFMTVDVDDPTNEKLIDQYEVSPIPTLVFLNPEGDVVTFQVGYSGDQNFSNGLKKILAQG